MKNIQNVQIKSTCSIREAMKVIDAGTLKLAFVLDDTKRLIATLSDGDIRRGLLRGIDINDNVSKIMNKNPYIIFQSSSIEKRLELLTTKNLHCLPVLSEDHKLVGVFTKNSLNTYARLNNPVLIMAGGAGKRLRPLTNDCPKPMLPISGVPLLEHIINRLKQQGFYNFYLSTFYLPKVISGYFGDGSDWGVNINYVLEDTPLGTGGALSLLSKERFDLPTIILNGDVFTDLDFTKFLEYHNDHSCDCTMCLREIETSISFGVAETQGGLVLSLKEKPVFVHNINMGTYVVSPSFVASMPYNKRVNMPDHIKRRIDLGLKVGAMWHSGYWLDIGRVEDYEKAQRELKNFMPIYPS